MRSVRPVLEQLEVRRLLSAATVQALPFNLDFGSDRGELVDKDGRLTDYGERVTRPPGLKVNPYA